MSFHLHNPYPMNNARFYLLFLLLAVSPLLTLANARPHPVADAREVASPLPLPPDTCTSCMASWSRIWFGGTTYQFFNLSTAQTGIARLWWDFGDGTSSTITNPEHTFPTGDIYHVTLHLVANDSCRSSVTASFGSYNGASCVSQFAALTQPDPLARQFINRSLIPQGGHLQNYLLDYGDGASTNSALNDVHRYNAPGTYVACQTITSSGGCTSTDCDTIVIGNGSSCLAGFSYWESASCDFQFFDSSFAAAGIASYLWDFGDGATSPLADPNHVYAAAGHYPVSLTIVANDGCTTSVCRMARCGAVPFCDSEFVWVPDTSGQHSILVTNMATGNGLSYYWDFGDGTSSTQAYPGHVYAGAGQYLVCLAVTNAGGCSATYCDTLDVVNRLSQPFSIQVVSLPIGVVQPSARDLGMTLIPNPAGKKAQLAFSLAREGKGQLRMIDALGRTVDQRNLGKLAAQQHMQPLDLSGMQAGIYLVELQVGTQRSVKQLVVTD
jgi:PKD repeat protein